MVKYLTNLLFFKGYKLTLVILSLLFLYGCSSVKPTTTKSGASLFETFYVGNDGMQYFIKPLLFTDDAAKEDLVMDFTFRYKDEVKDSAIVNFSIKSPFIYKSIDSLSISNSIIEIKNERIDLLFNEKTSKVFVSRFSTKVSLKDLNQLFKSNEWDVILYNQNEPQKYMSHKRTKKAIGALRDKVFILM